MISTLDKEKCRVKNFIARHFFMQRTRGEYHTSVNAVKHHPSTIQAIATSRNLRRSRFASENFFAANIPKKIPQQRQIAARMISAGIRNRAGGCTCPELNRKRPIAGNFHKAAVKKMPWLPMPACMDMLFSGWAFRQTALHQRVTFFVVHIEIRGIAFQQKRLFPIIEQIANQGEGQLILADDAFVYSNIKNGHVHVTDSRLMYRRQ